MPSPFPGMNPYLEQEDAWHDFHERAIPLLADRIGAQLGSQYIVKIDERIYIHDVPQDDSRRFLGRTDVGVARRGNGGESGGSVALLEAPVEALVPQVDIERVAYVEIRDRRNRQLVTLIELLSPSNKKPGPDRDQYLAKRQEILASGAHFVEIDLLRMGERMPVEPVPAGDYCVMVSRYEDRPRVGLWPVRLRERLPLIPIPLRAPDPNARLDLQQVLHDIYDAARYERYIYDGSPDPPLSPEDQAWANSLIPASVTKRE